MTIYADSPEISEKVIKSHGENKMKSYDRIARDPESIKIQRGVQTTDTEYDAIKLAARELKMPIGSAMALLSQNYLDELEIK